MNSFIASRTGRLLKASSPTEKMNERRQLNIMRRVTRRTSRVARNMVVSPTRLGRPPNPSPFRFHESETIEHGMGSVSTETSKPDPRSIVCAFQFSVAVAGRPAVYLYMHICSSGCTFVSGQKQSRVRTVILIAQIVCL